MRYRAELLRSQRHCRRAQWRERLWVGVAVVALLIGSGCAMKSGPSTLPSSPEPPARFPVTASPSTTETIPEYETDLSLSVDEKEATVEALTVLFECNRKYPRVFSDGGQNITGILEVTSGEMRSDMKRTADLYLGEGMYTSGEIDLTRPRLEDISLKSSGNDQAPELTIWACTDLRPLTVHKRDGSKFIGESTDKIYYMSYQMSIYDGNWTVSNMEGLAEGCK